MIPVSQYGSKLAHYQVLYPRTQLECVAIDGHNPMVESPKKHERIGSTIKYQKVIEDSSRRANQHYSRHFTVVGAHGKSYLPTLFDFWLTDQNIDPEFHQGQMDGLDKIVEWPGGCGKIAHLAISYDWLAPMRS